MAAQPIVDHGMSGHGILDEAPPDDNTKVGPPAALAEEALVFTFSGSGAEYFRIWIVNLLLTVATLGIYSAWAKTHRLQYFYSNTQLAGASFDFRGEPRAILRGRVLAVALLGAVYFAFGLSLKTGIATMALLLALMPFIVRSALRFRLSNTWYRGLPFGFAGTTRTAYPVYLLPLLVYYFPDVLDALAPKNWLLDADVLIYVFWPWLHGATRRYQQRHLMYGDQRAGFSLSAGAVAKAYVPVVAVGVAALATVFLTGVVLLVTGVYGRNPALWDRLGGTIFDLIGILLLLLGGPAVLLRMNNLAWSATTFPGVRIVCDMRTGAYLRLLAVNSALTLLTLGLFRPFAAVRIWRYRLAHLRVHASEGFETATLHAARPNQAAGGDGLSDLFGVDLSW